jgi:L-asparaginase/Glu-tRNA(Gln) amidotransferase subunit D
MNWFALVNLIVALSSPIVHAVEVLASHKAANGTPLTSADKAAAGVQLGNIGLVIAGVATGNVPAAQVDAVIKAVNDGTVAQQNTATGQLAPPVPVPVPPVTLKV